MNKFLQKNYIIIAGHRGALSLYPENTKISFQAAIDLGCDMIETDLHLTCDGHIVLMHDHTVDRTSNGHGKISDMTLEGLRGLDICCKCGDDSRFIGEKERPEFDNQCIMTLPEFCEMMQPIELLLNIEFKDDSFQCVDKAMNIFQEYNMTGRCVFTSFHPTILAYCHDKYGVRTQGFPKEYFSSAFIEGKNGTYSKMYAVGIGMKEVSAERVQEFVDMGIQPWAWCPDNEDAVKKCIDCGVTLITCNNPLPALRLLRKKVIE